MARIAADAFGNALGNSIAEANWSGSSPQTAKAEEPFVSYWDTHPMLYAPNDVADPVSPRVLTDAVTGTSGGWSQSGWPDNSALRAVGESADGGLVWNTWAVSYQVESPNIEVRPLPSLADSDMPEAGYTGYDEFGILTTPAVAPIGNFIANPIARAISGTVEGMHEFKYGAMSSINDEALAAARAGDDAALSRAGIRHTMLELMLPGSPQEVGLGVAFGAAAKPVIGVVAGELGRMLPDAFSMPLGDAFSFAPSAGGFRPGYQVGAVNPSVFIGDVADSTNTISREQIVNGLGDLVQPHLSTINQLDAEAMVGFRGSLARGFTGPHKGNLPFNPENFDVDALIVSDKLASQFGSKVRFRSGAEIPEIGNVQTSIDSALRQHPSFGGLRDDPFTFRIFTQQEIQRLQARPDAQYFFIKGR